jgi:hypothetical protein
MQHLDAIQRVVARHGVSLAEFLILDVASMIIVSRETAACYVARIMQGYSTIPCQAAVDSCLEKDWLLQSQNGILILTATGLAIKQTISGELQQELKHPEA